MGVLVRTGLVLENRQGQLRVYDLPSEENEDNRFTHALREAVAVIPSEKCLHPFDLDRLRWRLDLREKGRCVVTYTIGYSPDEYHDRLPLQRPRILIVCVHNSARSQIAEAYFHRFAEDLFEVESAGLLPGALNPYVLTVMAEEGFDLSVKIPRSVQQVYRSGRTFRYVITVCDPARERDCPAFPAPVERISWPFPDPATFSGSREEILDKVRSLRDEIRDKIEEFVARERARNGAIAPEIPIHQENL
ncbi:MAG: arsenate reductase ArsC [Spirochaetaceae bacterium]|nr:MAG: arsenate reductase ArsC [Spirochaetaceae bacterium]